MLQKIRTSVFSSDLLSEFLKTGASRWRKTAAIIILFALLSPLLSTILAESAFLPGGSQRLAHTLANNPPSFAVNLPMYLYPTTDVPYNMAIQVKDLNNDTVNVTWEWGDGSPNATDTTPPALNATWVNQTHTWSIPQEPGYGDYSTDFFLLNITLDDGMGGITKTLRYVSVYVPGNDIPEMDLSAPSNVDPGDAASIIAYAKDPEGDPLTWTFVFNDGITDSPPEVYHTPATGPNETVWNNITHIFGAEGDFTVRLNVSDALPPHQVWPHNISLTVPIESIKNRIPQVSGAIDASPQPLIINGTTGYLVVEYSVEAFDPDGDVLYVVWDFGDGSPTATNASAGGKGKYLFVQMRNYTDPGIFNISVVVSDNRPGHDVLVYGDVGITSNDLPSSVVSFNFNYEEGRSYGLPNETISFTLVLADPELDAIQIIVDFGDGSPLEFYNLSDFVGGKASLSMNHSFTLEGEYLVVIWYTDNKIGLFEHSKYYNVTVTVKEPPPVIDKSWTAWDYISLSLFMSAFIVPILWAIAGMHRRRRIDRGELPAQSPKRRTRGRREPKTNKPLRRR